MNTEESFQLSIKNLRRRGWKVRVMHSRHWFLRDRLNGTSTEVSARGGRTEIQITSPCKTINTSGVAECSDADNYNRKLGNSIALGRAWNKAIDKKHENV